MEKTEVEISDEQGQAEVEFDPILSVGMKDNQWYVLVKATRGLNGKECLDAWVSLTQFMLEESKRICEKDNGAERKKTADWLRGLFNHYVEHYLGDKPTAE